MKKNAIIVTMMTAMVTIITLIAVKYNGINTFRILESKKLKPSVKKK